MGGRKGFQMSNTVRTRPIISSQIAADGAYKGKFTSVTIKPVPDKYNDGKPHDVIHFDVEIKTPTGPVKLRKLVSYVESWSEKSNMYKLLDDLDCLPEPGTKFDFGSLVGKKLDVVVKNNTSQDGRTYSNIARLLPRSLKSVDKTAKKTVKVEEKPENDADFDFEDFGSDSDEDESDDEDSD